MDQTEVIVIGSGVGGLSCAALLAKYGFKVTVCESYSLPGGAAHSFARNGFKFDSGPSLYSGLSYSPSPNPLRQILDAIEEDLEWVNYDTWGCLLPEGTFATKVGGDQFGEILQQLRGDQAVAEWKHLQKVMEPIASAAIAIPPAAIRFDLGAALTVGRFLPNVARYFFDILKLTGPYSNILDENVKDPFIRNWLDLLCFLLSGLPANGTIAAEVAFMFADWYRPGVKLDYPLGGSGALVDALVRGLAKNGGKLLLSAHVAEIIVEQNRAVGVRLRDGKEIRATRSLISNASVWDTLKLLPKNVLPQEFYRSRKATPECDSFMHLHLGIDGTNLPGDLASHYIVVNDWDKGIDAPQNVVLVSIPSILDPNLAPPGKHVIHVYTPGNEPYKLWQGLDRNSIAYKEQKNSRSQIMWQALARIVPDIRSRCEVTMVGTPLTHQRFLRRHNGSYGPAIKAGKGIFPPPTTPLPGLFCCGDSIFPGIGLPAVAVSGMSVANTIAPVDKHLKMLKDIGVISSTLF